MNVIFTCSLKKLDKPKEEIIDFKFKVLRDHQDIKAVLKPNMAVHLELFDSNYHKSSLVGFSLSDGINTYLLIPDLALESIDFQLYLSDETIPKYTFDTKAMKVALNGKTLTLKGFLLICYLLHI